MLTEPLRPPDAGLVAITTSPELPLIVVPVLSITMPDTPVVSAFAVRTITSPELAPLPAPLTT
jgi:hypothetical protein